MNMQTKSKTTLISWYVNQSRIVELLGPDVLSDLTRDPSLLANLLGPQVLRWIHENGIKSLAHLLMRKKLKAGSIFIHEARYHSRGITHRDKPEDGGIWGHV